MFVDFLTEFLHRSSQLCSLFNVGYIFGKIVRFVVNMCRYDAFSLIHAKPQTNQM